MESLALYAAACEARAHVLGSLIREVTQPEPGALLLAVHLGAARHWLFLRGDRAVPAFGRAPHRLPRTPPDGFGVHAGRLLTRGTLEAIEQSGLDRVLALRIARREPPRLVRLVCEGIPGRGNLILVDGDQAQVLQVLHPVAPGARRPLWPGLAYAPPPRAGRPSLLEAAGSRPSSRACPPSASPRGRCARPSTA